MRLPYGLVSIIVPFLLVLCSYFFIDGHYKIDGFRDYAFFDDSKLVEDGDVYTRRVVMLPTKDGDNMLHAWVYEPLGNDGKPIPVVIMCHGLGAQKDMGLQNYARRFAAAGLASVIIDYRSFGGSYSSKAPRNLVNPWEHVDDLVTTIRAVKEGSIFGPRLNGKQIALWGSSFAGGHVLTSTSRLLSEDKETSESIKCLISQVPHLDGRAASLRSIKQRGFVGSLRVALIAILDFTRAAFGLSPAYVKIVATPDEKTVSYMTLTNADKRAYLSKHPKVYLGKWENLAPARTLLLVSMYSPIKIVDTIHIPILFVGASKDNLCPPELVKKAANLAPKGEYFENSGSTHFEIYTGDYFENSSRAMVAFLTKNLV